MCKFLSAIVMSTGDIICDPEHTDSHEDLIVANGLDRFNTTDPRIIRFVRVEFSPPDDADISDPDKYALNLDETEAPIWWDEDMRSRAEAELRSIVRRMIVNRDRKILLGGCWIICREANIEAVRSCRIVSMCDSARIGSVYDSARIGNVYGGARIDRACDIARICNVCDSARICNVCDSARIGSVYGSARIDRVYGSASIDSVCGSASIGSVYDSASIRSVYDIARIGSVYDSARIDSVYDSASISNVCGSAKIENDYRVQGE